MKKHELILKELKLKLERNNLNSCEPNEYMKGSNKVLLDMIDFIENKIT